MGNLSFVKSIHNKALLNDSQMSSLLGKMSIIPNLKNSKDLSQNLKLLSLQDKFLSYVNPDIELICQANLFLQGHHSKMIKFKKGWEHLWLEISTLEHLIYGKKGQNNIGNLLYKCLKLENPTEWDTIMTNSLDMCIRNHEKLIKGQKKLQKRSSIWSLILGEGSSIDKNTDDINKISDIFNTNFHTIHEHEGRIKGKINQIIERENTLSKQETTVYHHLQMLEMEKHMESKRGIYEKQREQQINFLLTLLQTSRVQKLVRKLKVGLQVDKTNDKDCQANRCMTEIRVNHNKKGLAIKTFWAKHVIRKRVQVTCAPVQLTNLNDTETSNSTWYISKFHKTVQDCFKQQMGNLTKINPQPELNFCNTPFENDKLRMTSMADHDFPHGIILKDNTQIKLYCTLELYVLVNDIRRRCAPKSPILVPNATEFKIATVDGAHMIEAHTLAQTWAETENVYNSETFMTLDNDISQMPPENQNVGYLNSIFELSDGRPHHRNLAITGTSIALTILTVIGALICWCKDPTCLRRMCSGCPQKRNDQEVRARMVNNILNQISEGMNSVPLETSRDTTNQPPTPPILEV